MAAAPAVAQYIPTGYQEYFVLGHEQQVWFLLNRVITGEGGGYTAGNGNNSVVSAVASADAQRIYYDHWEDGLEADILNPAQATTWILGDGNPANGDVCLWTTAACVNDTITAGMEVTLNSNEGLPGLDGCALAGTPNQIRCSVPLNPRCPVGGCRAANNQDIRFDGGDRIVSSGGPVSFVHNQDPKCAAGCGAGVFDMTIIGGATEVLSKQAFQNATSYSIPIGENLYPGANNRYQPFRYAALELVAFEDNTNVVITSPGSGALTLILNRGEHFTNCDTWTVAARNPCLTGQIDGPTRSVNVTPTITINSGTKVSTSAPVSGLMFAAGDGTFATHFMPLLPDLLHATDYVIPSVGDYTGAAPFPYPQADSRPLAPSSPAPVLALAEYAPDLPALEGVQYLVVTHALFEEQAERIALLKEAEGLKTAVVAVDQAYDRFSAGIVEAAAVKALIQQAHQESRGRLRYVLLVGDDTFDTHDYVGSGAVAYVPSFVSWDGEFGRVPSENRYADLDDDGAPEVAIGRLPVQTVEEAEALVAKIATQAEALGASAGRHLFVTDNSGDADAPFHAQAAAVQASLPPGSEILPLADMSAGADAARQALQSGWQSGAAVTHYFGHGGATIWADEQVLSVDTVESVAGTGKPTVLLAWACLSQFYQNFWGPAINESLLLLPRGGTVASFGPAGITSPAAQEPLMNAVYRNLRRPGVSLGEALRQAKVEALAANPRSAPNVVEGFNLLGDPALQVP